MKAELQENLATDTKPICAHRKQRHDLFYIIRCIMWFTAILPLPLAKLLPRSLQWLATIFNYIYEYFLYFVVLHIGILYICTIYLNFEHGDLEFLVNCLIQTIIYSWIMIVKIHFRHIKRHSVSDIMTYLNTQHRTHSAYGFTCVSMDQTVALLNKLLKIFYCYCVSGAIFWLCLPLFYNERILPLPCWYPLDYKQPIIYEFLYFLQIIGQLQVASSFAASSAFFLSLSIIISGQYDVLNCSLKNIIATSYINFGMPKDSLIILRDQQHVADADANQYFIAKEELSMATEYLPSSAIIPQSTKLHKAFAIALKDCVLHHRFILGAQSKMEKLYYILWFLKVGQVIFLMCLVAFVSVKSTNDNSFLRVLSLGQYLMLAAWEMFIICYAGEIVYINSQRCGEALLRNPWYLHASEMRNDISFFILNAQRPFGLTAGKIFFLNLQGWITVMKTAFSFLTLLQNIDERS